MIRGLASRRTSYKSHGRDTVSRRACARQRKQEISQSLSTGLYLSPRRPTRTQGGQPAPIYPRPGPPTPRRTGYKSHGDATVSRHACARQRAQEISQALSNGLYLSPRRPTRTQGGQAAPIDPRPGPPTRRLKVAWGRHRFAARLRAPTRARNLAGIKQRPIPEPKTADTNARGPSCAN